MMEQQVDTGAATVEDSAATTIPKAAGPGAMLREARERLGLSVADAAGQTKLAPRQIEALENDDYQGLPEMAFVRGFVRSYAKILQLDPLPMLAMLPQSQPGALHAAENSVEAPFPDAHAPRVPNLVLLGAALFLSVVVVAFAVYSYTTPRTEEAPEPEPSTPVELDVVLPSGVSMIPASEVVEASSVAAVSSVPEVNPPEPTPVAKAAAPSVTPVAKPVLPVSAVKPAPTTPVVAAKPSQPSQPAAATKPAAPQAAETSQAAVVRLTFGEESWTEVRDRNGKLVSSQLNTPGSELRLTGSGPYTLVVGHASAARVYHKGKKIDLAPYTNATSDVARLTLE